MDINSEALRGVFEENGRADDLAELRPTYAALKARALPTTAVPRGGALGDSDRIRRYALAYRQVLLHRTIALFEGALQAIICDNPYLMTLAIRAFFETLAPLGYLLTRLESLAAGNLKPAKVDQDIMTQLLGTKDSAVPAAMPPKQIMSLLDQADRFISKRIMGGKAAEHAMLRESYDHLSEFAHPNFHSNILAFDLDSARGSFVFREPRMSSKAFALIGYLVLASSLYVELHDAVDEYAPADPDSDK